MKRNSIDHTSLACETAELLELLPLGCACGEDVRYAQLRLKVSASAWGASRAGQFVMIRPLARNGLPLPLAWGHDILWARAFSICRVKCLSDNTFELVLFLQLVGRGTPLLLSLNPGDSLLVWGPLGNGFAVEPDAPVLMLAGGLGIAPFIGYSQAHPNPGSLQLEFGHRAGLDCYPWADFPAEVQKIAHFEQGRDDLMAFLARLSGQIKKFAKVNGLVLACGPKPFLQYVQKEAIASGARAQLSLETQMACGSGACLGCTVPAGPGLKDVPKPDWPVQVCLHGPVFWADEVKLS